MDVFAQNKIFVDNNVILILFNKRSVTIDKY